MSGSADDEQSFDDLGGLKLRTFTFGETTESQVQAAVLALKELDPLDALDLLQGNDFTGQLVWVGSTMLCTHLADKPSFVVGKRVLELGAGTGLAGIVAARLGAAHVTLSDGNERSIRVLERNLAANSLGPAAASVTPLVWSDALAPGVPRGEFATVLAADVAYSTKFIAALFDTVAAALAADGTFIYAHCPRGVGVAGQRRIDDAIELEAARVGLVPELIDLPALYERIDRHLLEADDRATLRRARIVHYRRGTSAGAV